MPKRLLFITGNANKLREVQAILSATTEAAVELQSRDLDLPELQGSVEEVSTEKCRRAAEIVRMGWGLCLKIWSGEGAGANMVLRAG